MNYIENGCRTVENDAGDHQVPQLEIEYCFEEGVYNAHHKQSIQVPELLNFPRLDDQVNIVNRMSVSIYVIGKYQLKGDLNTAPYKQWIQYHFAPVIYIFPERFLN